MGFTNPYPASRLTVDSTNSLVTGMQAWFPLTEGTGTSAQCILHPSHTGTLNGGVSWENGERGVVASFDGADDFIETNSNSTVTSFPITVSAWVKSSGSSRDVIFGSYNAVGTDRSLQCEIDAAGKMYMLCSSTGSYQSTNRVTGTTTLSTTEYSHVVFVFEASGGTLYLNGEVESSYGSLFSTLNTPVVNFLIGAQGTSSSNQLHFDGNISNVQVWDRAISATEVATLYHRPWEGSNYGDIWPYSPPVPSSMTLSTDTSATSLMTNCVGWWPLTEGSGTTATDLVGSNDGTQSGGVSWENSEIGNVASFDGSDDRFSISTDLSRNQTAFSCSAWIKPDAVDRRFIWYESNSLNALSTRFGLRIETSGNLQCVGRDDDGDSFTVFAQSGSGVVSTNEWQHVVGIFDPTGNGCKVFLDGVDVTSSSVNSGDGFPDTASLVQSIGTASTNYYWFDGLLSNVRVFDAALTADQVRLLYERPWEGEASYGDVFHHDPPAPASMLPLTSDSINTNQIGWWPCTDGSGSSLVDISSGSNDGTAAGSATFKTTSLGVAAEYDGSSSFHWLADSFSYTTDLTVSCWMRSDGTGVEQPAFCKGRSNGCTWWLGTNSSDQIRFATKKGGSLLRIDHDVASIADWHHLVLVQQATSPAIQAYVDGVSVYSGGSTGSLDSNSRIPMIGAATLSTSTPPGSIEDFEGNVSNVRIWSRVLSEEEIWSIYANPWLGSNYKLASGSTPLYNYIFRTERFRRLG